MQALPLLFMDFCEGARWQALQDSTAKAYLRQLSSISEEDGIAGRYGALWLHKACRDHWASRMRVHIISPLALVLTGTGPARTVTPVLTPSRRPRDSTGPAPAAWTGCSTSRTTTSPPCLRRA